MPSTQLSLSRVVETHTPYSVLVPDGKRCTPGLSLDPGGHRLSVVPEIPSFIRHWIYYIHNTWHLRSVSVKFVSVAKLLLPKSECFGFKDREIHGPNQQERGLPPKDRTWSLPDFKSGERLNSESRVWSEDTDAH